MSGFNEPKEYKTLKNLSKEEVSDLEKRLTEVKTYFTKREYGKAKITERELYWIIVDNDISILFARCTPYISQRNFFMHWIRQYPRLVTVVFDRSISERYKHWLITDGICLDISVYDKLADSKDNAMVCSIVEVCSLKKVKELRKHKNSKVRLKAYQRLGFCEYIDEMLSDRSSDVRLQGIKIAPYFYPKISDMIFENSIYVLYEVIKKIDDSCLPLLFASKHIDNPQVQELLEKRFDGDLLI